MENYVAGQLAALGAAVALGAAGGLVYDLLRVLRRRRPGLNEECEVYEVSVPDEALTDEDEDILNYDDLDDPDAFV